ncbi:MAG: DUF1800 domain-containing protein [Betaproteobacteria bacterium]|nr:MAG: DUF1800 domain-containing protein [Betaproteobacteria bacterium]
MIGTIGFLIRICAVLGTALAAAHAAPMGPDEARHLLLRTSFAAPSAEVKALAVLSRTEAVERLLGQARTEPTTRPPAELDHWTPRSQLRAMSEQERREWLRQTNLQGQELRTWWFGEMLATSSPFTERMTLFWHNHFVSSLQKVRPARLIYRQNLLLRSHALGNFRQMLHAISRDPAMIIYLDNAFNRKGQPNENFAREVMELFTLGEGNYSEHDIKEAARAFTGWGIDGETGEFRFRPAWHDEGVKTVLGRSGAFGGAEVLDILLEEPQTAELIVRKLWREYVSPVPDPREVERIAAEFRRSDYDIRVPVRALLASNAFYAKANRASLVKSPVELLVGTLRQFEFRVADPFPFVVMSRQLGQDLMAPPNVKGWPGGEHWINAGTLLTRKQILERLFRVVEPPAAAMMAVSAERSVNANPANPNAGRFRRAMQEVRFDPGAWAAKAKDDGALKVTNLLLPAPPVHPVPGERDTLALVRHLTLDPVYQLK